MSIILGPDDLEVGQFVAIHHGSREHCDCGCGAVGPESYVRLKGFPLAVNAICLPYVHAAVIPMGHVAILDLRECRLMRVDEAYLAAFIKMRGKEEQPAK